MSTNLHELTKQLDALTYNSRSVLNALIRSVMAAGSSTGWTVERAGVEVTMTRTDIFLLSSFYTEWEYTRFDKDQFDTIREKLDAQYADGQGMVSDTPVTYAIVQHSKIMTMTKIMTVTKSYWKICQWNRENKCNLMNKYTEENYYECYQMQQRTLLRQ